MPPKKKQGKKSGKKSGKAKKGKNKEPEITFQEAVLAYKLVVNRIYQLISIYSLWFMD